MKKKTEKKFIHETNTIILDTSSCRQKLADYNIGNLTKKYSKKRFSSYIPKQERKTNN